MARYRFDEQTMAALEHCAVPIGIYQVVDGQVVTLVASDGLCELFGYSSQAEAKEKMDSDMYWNVHPDDVKRVEAVAEGFVVADKPYNLVCRVLSKNGYHLLEDDYDIYYASDGVETLEVLRSHKDEIDLVLLDLQMPNMSGREVIAQMQVDEDLMSIPVIFLTVDQAAELDCLKSGAMDFIPKPYPDIDIVKARIAKCIELSEDRELIRYTERDKLTGLLNKDYFYRYVNRLDHLYKDTSLDAIVCDVNRFHSVNKQYGRQFGDLVLRNIGICISKLARKASGIGCRQGGDTFLIYCAHQDNYEQLFQDFLTELFAMNEIEEKVKIRLGVFSDAQQEADIEERFVHAKIAADRVKEDPQKICGYYNY